MRPLLICAVSAVLAASAIPASAAPPERTDDLQLRAIAREIDAAWDAADAGRMAEFYLADASLWLSGAPAAVDGRDAIRRHFTENFAARNGVLRHVGEITRMDALDRNLVFADLDVRVDARQPDGSWKTMRRFKNATLLSRDAGAWKVRVVRAYVTN